eukprot:gene22691-biopygen8169
MNSCHEEGACDRNRSCRCPFPFVFRSRFARDRQLRFQFDYGREHPTRDN